MDQDQRDTLLRIFERLSAVDQAAVRSFAEFLSSRADSGEFAAVAVTSPPAPVAIPEPEDQPRPDNEKVVAAVKRLSKTYFMLDKSSMLGVTSDLMTQHVIQRRDAEEVIDELEQLFAEEYQKLKQGEC